MAITGLILAGGQGARMAHCDKGLQSFAGTPLVQHALQRLLPQVDTVMISANRNLEDYSRFGTSVFPDNETGFAGPLAGLQAGLAHCTTPLLISVPCDAPFFPNNLVTLLNEALITADADIAVASAGRDENRRSHPVFCLLRMSLLDHLTIYLHEGGRKVSAWQACHKVVQVPFNDENAFRNINSLEDLQRYEAMYA
jgi:molybdopterin-guanine dinucleotide biosynthesis protein A